MDLEKINIHIENAERKEQEISFVANELSI